MSHGNVRGVALDAKTRCAHYHADSDVISLKFGCCEKYYACYRCHEELTTYDAEPWPTERCEEPAVRCGVCADHSHLYFAWVNPPDRSVS